MSIAQLTAGTHITRQAITKHLQVLADAGLVHDIKIGRERRWQFEPARFAAARQHLETIGRPWNAPLERWKQLVA